MRMQDVAHRVALCVLAGGAAFGLTTQKAQASQASRNDSQMNW
jgi:hypothetical protein